MRCALPKPLPLPGFPWDTLRQVRELAAAHPQGIVDLSVGTPVDDTPALAQRALAAAANAPGYPLVEGTAAVKTAVHQWLERRGLLGVPDRAILPTIGSKEAIAWTPTLLGMGPGDEVYFPDCAYPTYDVSARLCGATPVPVDQEDVSSWPEPGGGAVFVWLNSPSNPTGHVLDAGQMRRAVEWARQHGAVLVSDECYAELPWAERYVRAGIPSVLQPEICGNSLDNLILVYSLSKQSNLAGYRDGILVGATPLIDAILEGRKHTGFMTPTPVQAVLAAMLPETGHVAEQRQKYLARREKLLAAVGQAGLEADSRTEAGLYLWLKAGASLAAEIADLPGENWGRKLGFWLAERGILVAPGDFYGANCTEFVRMGLTATDERIDQAVTRLTN